MEIFGSRLKRYDPNTGAEAAERRRILQEYFVKRERPGAKPVRLKHTPVPKKKFQELNSDDGRGLSIACLPLEVSNYLSLLESYEDIE